MRKSIVVGPEQLIGKGGWVSLYGLNTAGGRREILMRNNGRFKAAKCLVLYVDKEVWKESGAESSSDLPTFLANLRRIGLPYFSVFFLAADRPCTYPESQDLAGLTENYQLEIPGGVADAVDEDGIATGLREACEEYGCAATDVVMTAPLVTGVYAANDAGGQVEFYSTCAAVVTKKPEPPKKKKGEGYREGIIPEKCVLVPLLEAENFLMEQGRQGIALEWLALASLFHLGLELLGGWKELT
ncbi:MAG: hypothetical protein AAB352_03520 [Patescibacteria group bacterium]